MGRISASLSGIERLLLNRLAESNAAIELSSLRVATGRRINFTRENPSGFVTVDGLRARLSNLDAAATNVSVASDLGAGAQQTIDLIRDQLDLIREKALEDEDGDLMADERAANQAAIDAAIAEINRLATSDISGRRLLDGSTEFAASGVNRTQVKSLDVQSIGGTTIAGSVVDAATQAQLSYTGAAGAINSGAATFTLEGSRGSVSISVSAGQSLTSVAAAINAESHRTGVTAVAAGDTVTFTSVDYGSSAWAGVTATLGTFTVTGGTGGVDTGTDAVVTINGVTATAVSGNRVDVRENGLQFRIEFQPGFEGTFDTITLSEGGAMRFALAPELARPVTLAIPGLHAALLGGDSGTLDQLATGGSAAGLSTNAPLAIRIVDEAISDLVRVKGRVDGFADTTIDSAGALMEDLRGNTEDAIDAIDGVNEAEETLLQAKYQALADNAVSSLAIIGQQRSSIVELIRQLAGLG